MTTLRALLPDPRHPGRDPNARTLKYIPERDDASHKANLFLPYSPGPDDANAMLAADQRPQAQQPPATPQAPAEPGASAEPGALAETDPSQSGNVQARPTPEAHTPPTPATHEEWRLGQKGKELPGFTTPAAGLDNHGTFSTDLHENEKLIAKQRQADAIPGRVISHEEYLQKKNMASLLDDMADQAFPDTGDMKPEVQAQKHAYKQDIISRAVEAMRSGTDAKGIFADELVKLPGDAPIDWGRVEEAARRPEAFDPNHLKQTYGNDDLHEVPQSWRYGMREREKNVLAEKIMDHTITPKERENLAELERTLIPRAERRNGMHAMVMDGIEAGPDELDKLGHAAVTGAAYAGPGAAIGTAGGPGGALAGAGHGFRTGAIVGYATKDLSRTAAKVYRELDSHIDENGEKLSENTKQATAAACGLIAAGADVSGLLGLDKMAMNLMGEMSPPQVAQTLLTNPTARKNLERLRPYLSEMAILGGSEIFQSSVKSFGKWMD